MKLSAMFFYSLVVLLSVVLLPLLENYYSLNWIPWSSTFVVDLLVTNGTIYTSDESLPLADSMVIRNGRVIRVGNRSSVQDLVAYGTQELNLQGKILVPGFIDSHVHFIFGGLQMSRVQLQGVNRKDEFVKRIKDTAAKMNRGSWILGGGWNSDLWGGESPAAAWIDEITPHNPVWLTRMDGHMGLANSLALEIAGINNYSKDPDGGIIMRNRFGEPIGLLVDSAMKLVFSYIPDISITERREAFLEASRLALKRGVTTVVDFGRFFPGASVELSWEDFADVYEWADLSGQTKMRFCLFFPMKTWPRLLDLVNKRGRKLSQWVYLGGMKAYTDGSLGSNSALFYEPYIDEPQNYGLQLTEAETLFNMTSLADKAGLQVAIHAIGDRANDIVLDVYDSVASINGMRDRRFRIEHAQHLSPKTVVQFGKQGIVASVQPDHLLSDADSATKKLGFERASSGSYLFQSLLDHSVRLAFGSDWPVVDINPLNSMRTAIKRRPHAWENPWNPKECIKLNDALNAHTISAAHACFLDEDLGSLSPGKMADFVVLSSGSWDDILEAASVEATYVGGKQVYP